MTREQQYAECYIHLYGGDRGFAGKCVQDIIQFYRKRLWWGEELFFWKRVLKLIKTVKYEQAADDNG